MGVVVGVEKMEVETMKGLILGIVMSCMVTGCAARHDAAVGAATTASVLLDETSSKEASRDTENLFLDIFGWNDTPKTRLHVKKD